MSAEELLRTLGERVRSLRVERGWSQEDLAAVCGRHFTYIGRIERGEQNVTLEVLYDVAAALGVSVAELLPWEHPLLTKWKVGVKDVLEAINHGFRAQVDVRGKLAEWMLFKQLRSLKDQGQIEDVEWLDKDGEPDFILHVKNKKAVVQCKNVRSLSRGARDSSPIKVELQRTRNAKDGSRTRWYRFEEFDVLSVCLFNRTGQWDFYHIAVNKLTPRRDYPEYLQTLHDVPHTLTPPWRGTILEALEDRWVATGDEA